MGSVVHDVTRRSFGTCFYELLAVFSIMYYSTIIYHGVLVAHIVYLFLFSASIMFLLVFTCLLVPWTVEADFVIPPDPVSMSTRPQTSTESPPPTLRPKVSWFLKNYTANFTVGVSRTMSSGFGLQPSAEVPSLGILLVHELVI